MKPKSMRLKTTNQIIWENRLERRLQQQDFEKRMLELIDQLPESDTREEYKSYHLDNLSKCQQDITWLQTELKKIASRS
ncbi:hypothetical protein PCCS19_38590 [Paenibacillus sp. CCS19]|uniref:hypothetical protein n=1 Tax=Paenibacillus sp. CCS19 TaxID=3158387 RepID=UPI00256B13A6|nr:hypothetical protein [Paenibacillus cellulosilyticus]GMK40803.1 hypothetical protein PCCS19_38590 [Paenibacillus cellulosilyticus]